MARFLKRETCFRLAGPRADSCLTPPAPAERPSAAPHGARAPQPPHGRPGRAAAAVLVVGLLLLGAAAAEAQTPRVLVSNVFQTADDSADTNGNDHAQLFHTAGNAAGYTLTSVLVNSDDAEHDDFDVEICEEDGSADEFPSTPCTALTAPTGSSAFSGNVQFTHTGLALSANTNYVLVITQRGTGNVKLDSTTSGGEDADGLSGWSIKDKFYWKSGSTWMIKSGSNEALSIIVSGYQVMGPGPPTNLTRTLSDGCYVTMDWSAPASNGGSAITRYQIRRRVGNGSLSSWQQDLGNPLSTGFRGFFTCGVSHTYQFRAVNANGPGPPAEITFTPVQSEPPFAPVALAAVGGFQRVALSWETPPATFNRIDYYQVRYHQSGAHPYTSWTRIPHSNYQTTRHTVTGLADETPYTIQVRAVNSEGGGKSAQWGATTQALPVDAPSGFVVTAGIRKVNLAWTAAASTVAVERYQYRRSTDGGDTWNSWTDIAGSDATTTRHTVSRLANGTAYTVALRIRAGTARSAAASRSATTPDVPSAPGLNRARPGDRRSITLTWTRRYDGGRAITKYQYRRTRGSPGFTLWATIPGSSATTTGYTHSDGLSEGRKYSFEVRAVNAVGNGRARRVDGRTAVSGAPTIRVWIALARESRNAAVDFTVELHPAASSTVTVDYHTEDRSATAPEDYQATAGTLTFEAGETEKTVSVPIVDDPVEDSGESFALLLSNVSGARLGVERAAGLIYNHEDVLAGFTLVDAASGTDVGSLTDGTEVTLDAPATGQYGVRVETIPAAAIGSLRLALSGAKTVTRTDNAAPYTLYAEGGEGLPPGAYTLQATAYPDPDGGGSALQTRSVSFTVAAATADADDGAALSASFPASRFASTRHTGSDDRPQVVVTFSETVATFAANTPSVQVTGGTVSSVQAHTEDGLAHTWLFFLTPDGDGDVTFALATDAACASGGICTPGGTMLTQVPAARTIPGPGAAEDADQEDADEEDVAAALSASFAAVPAAHDGSTPFTFTLTFSEAPTMSYVVLRDDAFSVSDGSVKTAIRAAPPSNLEWEITVEPDGDGDLTITLATTADCDASDAICTSGGTVLTEVPAALTIPGPDADDESNDGGTTATDLTASFGAMPSEHAGSGTEFVFQLTFSEEPKVGYEKLRDDAFTVTGGEVRRAQRRQQGSNVAWNITVEPSGWGDIAISLPGGRACTSTGGVCTVDNRQLSNSPSGTVQGPAALSVADANAQEGTDPTLDFAVTLNREASSTVTVAYATSDGSATAGADYTATSGTLTFAAGETEQTVAVAVLDDAHDDGGETFTLTLSNPTGGVSLADGTATGTIENTDPLQRAWLARFGRTVATHVTDAVGERLRGAPGQASHVTVGGHRLPLGRQAQGGGDPAADKPAAETDEDSHSLASLVTGLAGMLGLGSGQAGGPGTDPWGDRLAVDPRLGQSQSVTLDLRRLLLGSSFRLALGGDDAGSSRLRLTAWGRVAGTTFDGQDGTLSLDGDVLTGTVGVDSEWDRLLAGLAVAHSRSNGSFTMPGTEARGRGELETTLTSIHPYLRYAVTDRLDVWGVLGYGWGEVTVAPAADTTMETDTNLIMGAFGGRGILLPAAETGGFELATRTDAMLTRTTSEAVAGLASGDADAHRLRLILEGSRGFTWAEGRSLTPSVELGLRHDWGDAETGFGVELGGRVQYADPALGLTIEGAVRALLAHEDADYEEWGAWGTVRVAPRADGQGLALTLSPTWGAASSGVDGLWSRQTTAGLAPEGNTRASSGRLNAEIGYGVPAPFGTGLLTPYAGTVLAEGSNRTYRLGARWVSVTGLTMTLEGLRQEAIGQQPVNQGLQVQAGWGF